MKSDGSTVAVTVKLYGPKSLAVAPLIAITPAIWSNEAKAGTVMSQATVVSLKILGTKVIPGGLISMVPD